MLQIARALSLPAPACGPGHRPQLVETRGAPRTTYVGDRVPSQWHVECCACQRATVPTVSRALAELRWIDQQPHRLIPLSDLGRERASMAALNAA